MAENPKPLNRPKDWDAPLNVLLVEDNDDDAEFLEIILSRVQNPPFNLERAIRMHEAIARLKVGGIDLAIVDLSLPDSRGFETFTTILRQFPEITIVVLSGYNDETLALRALNFGAQDYMVKGNLDTSNLSRSMRFAIERKRAESALRESEERMRAVVDNALETIITLDEDGTILSFNPAGELTFGYLAKDIQGKHIRVLLPEPYRTYPEKELQHFLHSQLEKIQGNLIEVRGYHQSGENIPLEISINEVFQDGRKIFMVVARDITKRKIAEENLRVAQDKLVHSSKMAVLGQMSAGISHELNQPLEAMQAYIDNVEFLLENQRYDEVRSNFQAISDLTRKAGKIIKNMKNMALRKQEALHPIQPQSVLESVLFFLSTGNRLEGIAIEKKYSDESLQILGQNVQMEQVLSNIISNSLDAMEKSPERILTIEINHDDDEVKLSIRDTGPGIPESALPNLFQPFFTTKELEKGLGLGLAISSTIVREFGGTIEAANHSSGGAEFSLTFPRVNAPVTTG